MKSELFTLEGAPEIEKKLRRTVRSRLRERSALDAEYGFLWKREIAVRSPGMSFAAAVRFLVWQRQFGMKPIPGLGRVVGAARALVKRVAWLHHRWAAK